MLSLIALNIQLRGVAASSHPDAIAQYPRVLGRGMKDGSVVLPVTRFSWVDQAPRALIELIEGRHVGTVVVEL